MKYENTLPEDIRFGNGIRHVLAEILPPGTTLIICGRHAVNEIERDLTESLKSLLGVAAKVTLVAPGTIARSEGKAKRVIDKRKLK